MASNNTIVLKGDLGDRHEEAMASGILSPGHLIMYDSDGKVLKHATSGGIAKIMVAIEDALAGKTITDAYAVGDLVLFHQAKRTDLINFRVPAASPAIVKGDFLISNGDGCLVKSSGGSGQVAYSNTAPSAAVTNTTVETAFDKSYTFAAGSLHAGDVIRIFAQGIATATHSTDTLNVKLKIGSTTIVATGAVDVADNNIFYIDARLIVRTVGSGGTFTASGVVYIGAPGTAPATFILASTTINTTTTQAVTVTATWSVADVGNSVRLDELTIAQQGVATGSSTNILAVAEEAVDNSGEVSEAFLAAWVL